MEHSVFERKCNCQDCLRKTKVFHYLTEEELVRINEARFDARYNAGEIIFKQGTALTHLMSFTSGLGKVYLEGFNKRNLILKLIKPGEFIGGPGMYTDFKHHYTISAIDDSTACFIDINVYKDILSTNPIFAMHSHKNSNENTVEQFHKFISLTQKQMAGRIADSLIYLHDEIYQTNPFRMTLSRQELADMTSMSKESAIRILKQLKDDLILKMENEDIEIINMNKLTEISKIG